MRLELSAVETLIAVADHGGIGAAARALGVTQPAVTDRLRRLERQVRLDLVARSPRGSQLTANGRLVADWGRDLLVSSDRLEAGIAALRDRHAHRLRVSASMTVAEYLVPRWLHELRISSPDASVALRMGNSEQAARDVREGAADVGFVEGPRVPAGLSSKTVAVDELVVVVAPGHRWARLRRPLSVAELVVGPLVVREPGSGTREALERELTRLGAVLRPSAELGSSSAVRSVAESGDAAAVLSRLVVADDVASGRLVPVPVDGIDLHRRLRAIWPAGTRLQGPAADLVRVASGRG
jgi:DNA-binding transcriptional LysR family regulator